MARSFPLSFFSYLLWLSGHFQFPRRSPADRSGLGLRICYLLHYNLVASRSPRQWHWSCWKLCEKWGKGLCTPFLEYEAVTKGWGQLSQACRGIKLVTSPKMTLGSSRATELSSWEEDWNHSSKRSSAPCQIAALELFGCSHCSQGPLIPPGEQQGLSPKGSKAESLLPHLTAPRSGSEDGIFLLKTTTQWLSPPAAALLCSLHSPNVCWHRFHKLKVCFSKA